MKTWITSTVTVLLMFWFALAHAFDKDDPKFKEWFEKAKIGETYGYARPAGDGCNTCGGQVRKISDTEVADSGVINCTLASCIFNRTIKVKP